MHLLKDVCLRHNRSRVKENGNKIYHIRIKLIMHVYRYQYKKRKKVKTGVLSFMCIMIVLVLLVQVKKENALGILKEWKAVCYEEVMELCMPGIVYSSTDTRHNNVVDEVLGHFFLLEDEVSGIQPYETQVESVLSYEAILAREAADENYIDAETGELVLSEGTVAEPESSVGQTNGQIGTGSSASGEKQVTYAREKLNDFDYLIQNFYQVDSTTTIDGSQLNADALLGKDMRLSHDASTPQILIYHTHSQEGYADSVPGDAGDTVVGVGDYLTQILTEQYGFNVIHHKGEYDVGDRDHAYSNAAPAIEQILAENPSIEVVIDLHRDGVPEDTRLVANVNGTQMAQVMFFNGLSRTTSMGNIDYLHNPYIADNLALSFQMQLKAAEYYSGFTRRIYLKGYRYNMHYCPKTLLVEVGAQTNTVEEAMNAMVPLADVLHKVLTQPQ